jgi:MFS family permease
MSSAAAQTRIGTRRALPWSLGLLILGAIALAAAPTVLPVLVAGLLLVSFGMSSSQVSSQADALASVDPTESGRANTVFMATTFFASSAATALSGLLMSAWGYAGVGILALALSAGSLTIALVVGRRR